MPADLQLAHEEWYAENGITLYVGDRATSVDRRRRLVTSQQGREVEYDAVVLATGSAPFVPCVPGVDKKGVFVYRTIEDLERILAYAGTATRAAVIGGGLLGLEAAKAVRDLKLETHVVELAPRLMPRQVDDAGGRILRDKIEGLGVDGPPGCKHPGVCRQRQGRRRGVYRWSDGASRHGRHFGGDLPPRRAGPRLWPGGRSARGCRRR